MQGEDQTFFLIDYLQLAAIMNDYWGSISILQWRMTFPHNFHLFLNLHFDTMEKMLRTHLANTFAFDESDEQNVCKEF